MAVLRSTVVGLWLSKLDPCGLVYRCIKLDLCGLVYCCLLLYKAGPLWSGLLLSTVVYCSLKLDPVVWSTFV